LCLPTNYLDRFLNTKFAGASIAARTLAINPSAHDGSIVGRIDSGGGRGGINVDDGGGGGGGDGGGGEGAGEFGVGSLGTPAKGHRKRTR
jgi:hypothetical protein